MAVQIVVVVLAGAGDDGDAGGPQLLQHGAHRGGGAAAAQYQHLFARHGDAAVGHHPGKAVGVGVVAVQGAVLPVDQHIHAAQLFRDGGQLGAVGDDRFLVGDGDIQSGEVPAGEKLVQLVLGALIQLVVVVPQQGVDGRGVAVAQLFP